ncbi:MAG: T9SS type A sorting domain-containing protein [Cloacibacterium normanense]
MNISSTQKIEKISVYNSLGQFLFESKTNQINIEKLEKGLYFF